MSELRDVAVIGAGPVGLACAIEVRRRGLTVRVFDKGTLVNSIFGYPTNMEFFSTPDLIEIGGYPFPVQRYKPTREDALEYYRGVAAREGLELSLYDRVDALAGERGAFTPPRATGGGSPAAPRPGSPAPASSSSRPAFSIAPTPSACPARTCRRSPT